jgi:hypothetical protein
MDGNAQNLKSVAIDWGSIMRLERRETEAAKSWAVVWRNDVMKVSKPIGWPKRKKLPLISESLLTIE